jgi:hypothetical protein
MRDLFKGLSILLFYSISVCVFAQEKIDSIAKEVVIKHEEKWFDKISLGGYVQLRYNGLLQTNPDLECEQCDKSWGGENNFFFRRLRLRIAGQVSDHMYFYIQPDLAIDASSGNQHFGQIRDAYFDWSLDKDKEFRFRFGQSKTPYGFENMQSSQNRLALDRNDAINSAQSNERDLGVFFYWAPKKIRERFEYLVKSGLKGSGDYGVLGLGVYNGQTANKPEANEDKHIVGRLTYPFMFKSGQIIEASIQAYKGKFVVNKVTKGVRTEVKDFEFKDDRVAGTLVIYPQPFGLQAEYNIGRGPEFNTADSTIRLKDLKGGYILLNYRQKLKHQLIYPFVRYHYYDGGKKFETDARSYLVKELEIGIEYQPIKNLEFVAMYTISDRKFEDFAKPVNHQVGNLLRIQVQLNY